MPARAIQEAMASTTPHTTCPPHKRRRRRQRRWAQCVLAAGTLVALARTPPMAMVHARTTTHQSTMETPFGTVDPSYKCMKGDDGRAGACNHWMQQRICASGLQPLGTKPSRSPVLDHLNTIRIGAMLPLSGVDGLPSPTNIFGMLCAIEEANKAMRFPNDAKLDLYFADTLGLPVGGTAGALCLHNLNVPVIVGPSFSGAAAAASTVAKVFHLPVIGTTASSPNLANPDEFEGYPTFSRVMANDAGQAAGLVQLAKRFGWRRIATLSLINDEYGTGLLDAFKEAAGKDLSIKSMWYRRFNYAGGGVDSERVDDALQEIRESGLRVILLTGYGLDVESIWEQAKAAGMTGEGWAWLGSDSWVSHSLLRARAEDAGRQKESGEFADIIGKGGLGLVPHVDTSSPTWKVLEECHASHLNDTTGAFANLSWVEDKPTWSAAYAYDAMYVAALGLEKLYSEQGGNYPLSPGEKLTSTAQAELLQHLRSASFLGATGNVTFTCDGERNSSIKYDIVNILHDGFKVVGSYDSIAEELTLNDDLIVFSGGTKEVPNDRVEECVFSPHIEYNLPLSYAFFILGAVLAIGCAYFNVRYRNNKIVRISAWRVNVLTIFGCFLAFVAVFLWSVQASQIVSSCRDVGTKADYRMRDMMGAAHASPAVNHSSQPWSTIGDSMCTAPTAECQSDASMWLCATPMWFFGMSWSIAFGTLFAKMYRITKLFSGIPVRRRITDVHVMGYVAALVCPMAILLFVWTHFFPMVLVFDVEQMSRTTFRIHQYCTGPSFSEFLITLVFVCGLMIMLGAFFAWSVKDVWIKEVNDSRSVALCIYTILVVGSIGYMSAIVLDGEAAFLVMFSCGWGTTAATLLFLFVPKMYQVFFSKDGPDGNFTMYPMRHAARFGNQFETPHGGGVYPVAESDVMQQIQNFETYKYSSNYTFGGEESGEEHRERHSSSSSGSYYNSSGNNSPVNSNNKARGALPAHNPNTLRRRPTLKASAESNKNQRGKVLGNSSPSASHPHSHRSHRKISSIGDFNDDDLWVVTPMSSRRSHSSSAHSRTESRHKEMPVSHASVVNPMFRFAPKDMVQSWREDPAAEADDWMHMQDKRVP